MSLTLVNGAFGGMKPDESGIRTGGGACTPRPGTSWLQVLNPWWQLAPEELSRDPRA